MKKTGGGARVLSNRYLPHQTKLFVGNGIREQVSQRAEASRWLEQPFRQDRRIMERIVSLVEDTRWGLDMGQDEEKEVNNLVEQLKNQKSRLKLAWPVFISKSTSNDLSPHLDGCWSLKFTTEKSVRKVVQSNLPGLSVQSILQQIDLQNMRVTNEINFSSDLFKVALRASAPASVSGPNKLDYAFDAIALELFGLSIPLPFPSGVGGWTQAVFVDEDYRLVTNSLGDTLCFQRHGI